MMVATASAHRAAAFAAAEFLMDYLKSRAPFWKKEPGTAAGRPGSTRARPTRRRWRAGRRAAEPGAGSRLRRAGDPEVEAAGVGVEQLAVVAHAERRPASRSRVA